jgi:4-hydroxythreonine-4-phosphate dehydrogenase
MKNVQRKPRIGITMGDPVGIGAEVIVKALGEESIWEICLPLVLGDVEVVNKALRITNSHLEVNVISNIERRDKKEKFINLISLSNLDADRLSYGKPDKETGKAMVSYIKEGIRLALEKKIDALVTCPINKKAMSLAGYSYPGHTELLAEATNTKEYAMMLAGEKLKVVLATIHIPLKEVPDTLTSDKILTSIRLSDNTLRKYFGINRPKVAVTALNPHAGENGLFGVEEKRIIEPAINQAKIEGINVSGPFSSDTLFFYASKGKFDAVICMYHDQGLIPLKLLHFDDAVNITLGLPIIRTSVDHGTAYDIAGTGKANPKSLINAIKLAAQMVIISKN